MVFDDKPSALQWRKSTFSPNDGCVEVAFSAAGAHVRNTRNTGGERLAFSWSGWREFLRFIGER
ncbi:DUF397 domain-containing protein [Saccharothrix sp.]|uniref:DUF397 domain-containing protein n=1 Tax=Saccharothrix sp. TaxID=1873460 RepID=UPI002811E485|nr:DUF397 domain-containing protein [Saccharothrix sp.]